MAAKIARGIVAERARGPIQTTRHLARIVAGEKGSREKIDPATRVFQALRIEVNQELVALARFLAAAVARLNAGGRLAVISYHSLEDRIVKDAFRRDSGVCFCPPKLPTCICGARAALELLTRRPSDRGRRSCGATPAPAARAFASPRSSPPSRPSRRRMGAI